MYERSLIELAEGYSVELFFVGMSPIEIENMTYRKLKYWGELARIKNKRSANAI